MCAPTPSMDLPPVSPFAPLFNHIPLPEPPDALDWDFFPDADNTSFVTDVAEQLLFSPDEWHTASEVASQLDMDSDIACSLLPAISLASILSPFSHAAHFPVLDCAPLSSSSQVPLPDIPLISAPAVPASVDGPDSTSTSAFASPTVSRSSTAARKGAGAVAKSDASKTPGTKQRRRYNQPRSSVYCMYFLLAFFLCCSPHQLLTYLSLCSIPLVRPHLRPRKQSRRTRRLRKLVIRHLPKVNMQKVLFQL
jgi:hypothetical protein